MRIKYLFLGIVMGFALAPAATLAHAGGNPYVYINHVYVKSNPVAGLDPTSAQDLAPSNYTVNQPINFAIDLNVFSTPDMRWDWDNQNDYSDGLQVNHTYTTPGTHLITLQVASDLQHTGFITVDTIGINILPKANYIAPSAKIRVEQLSSSSKGYLMRFSAITTKDPSAKVTRYDWQFGDSASGQGQAVEHLYQKTNTDFRIFPTLHMEDRNALSYDLIFELDSHGNTVAATNSSVMANVVASSTVDKPSYLKPVSLSAVAILLIAGGFIYLKKR